MSPLFSEKVPSLQVAWDSTSFRFLQECPRKYHLSMIRRLQSKKFRAPLTFGILAHKALEEYHRRRAEGQDHDTATKWAVQWCMTEGKILDDPRNDDSMRTRFTLSRAIAWYLDHYEDDPAKTIILANGKPAVELSFRLALPMNSPDGDPYLWCGHIDRLVDFGGEIQVIDIKTTGYSLSDSYFSKYSPNNQMSGYIFAASIFQPDTIISKAIIDGIELKVNFNRFKRGFTTRTEAQLNEWQSEVLEWILLAENFARARHWPANYESCDKFGGCVFREVCSRDPSTREQWLKGDFDVTPQWNPLEAREG